MLTTSKQCQLASSYPVNVIVVTALLT